MNWGKTPGLTPGLTPAEAFLFFWGQVAEWFKAHAWKACGGATHSRVRIPPCPSVV